MIHNKIDLNDPNQHPSIKLAIEDVEFLKREELRGTRLGLEYDKVNLSLNDWGIKSMVTVFGSARIQEVASVEKAIKDAKKKKDANLISRLENLKAMSHYYDEARDFARIVSENGGAMDVYGRSRHNVIASGGGPGIMEAVNRGASDVGAPTLALV